MRLYINDVAVRDGFQIEKAFIPTATKIEVVNQLSRTGLHKIQVTSFVSAKAVPALADANDCIKAALQFYGEYVSTRAQNPRGTSNK